MTLYHLPETGEGALGQGSMTIGYFWALHSGELLTSLDYIVVVTVCFLISLLPANCSHLNPWSSSFVPPTLLSFCCRGWGDAWLGVVSPKLESIMSKPQQLRQGSWVLLPPTSPSAEIMRRQRECDQGRTVSLFLKSQRSDLTPRNDLKNRKM